MQKKERFSLLGVEVDRIFTSDVLDFIDSKVASGKKGVVANHNIHSIYLYHKCIQFRNFYEKVDIIEIDSMLLILWGRMMGHRLVRANRCTYLDFRQQFWSLASKNGWKIYHIGGKAKHNLAAKAAILKRHPNVHLDTYHGYFDINGEENKALLDDIHSKAPDVLLVGMGMPRQELWLLSNYERLPNCVSLPIGAAFDYEAGVSKAVPRWIGQIGLEWLVRFIFEPSRLFSRYFLEPWSLLPFCIRDFWRYKLATVFQSRNLSHHSDPLEPR